VTVVLKQAKDDPLAKALDRGGIFEICDVLKGMLKTLKLFIAYMCQKTTQLMIGPKSPRNNFKFSNACITATEKDNKVVLPIPSTISKKKTSSLTLKKRIKRDDSLFSVLKNPM